MGHPINFSWPDAAVTGARGRRVYVYEITLRTIAGLHLMAPNDKALIKIHWGVFGKAMSKYPCELYAVHALSNHLSYLIGFYDPADHSKLKRFLHSLWARETNIRRKRSGSFWGRRARSILGDTEASLLDRLRYSLSNGCKEFLVGRPEDWPGVHAAKPLVDGTPAIGTWIKRTEYWAARAKDKDAKLADYAEEVTVTFSKLPGLTEQSDEEYKATIKAMCDDIAETCRIARGDKPLLGVSKLKTPKAHRHRTRNRNRTGCWSKLVEQLPRREPSPAPAIHTSCPLRRARFRLAYIEHVDALRARRDTVPSAA
jgi:hypothetical protein